MKSLWAAERFNVPRYDTVQNNFSLINRRCESELAQVCRREQVSLLPYSPLGGCADWKIQRIAASPAQVLPTI